MKARPKYLRKAGRAIGWFFRQDQLDLLPLRRTMARYTGARFRGDFRAGLNVALLAFPQAMAYAFIAGLPVEFGLYGSAVAAIVAPLLAGSHFITLGPTNATAVMLLSAFASAGVPMEEKIVMLPLLLIMAGGLLVAGAYLRVANLIQYISRTVVTGYITAAALYIVINQLGPALGFGVERDATTFLAVVMSTFRHGLETSAPSVAMSAATLALFLALERKFPRLPNVAIVLVVLSAAGWAMGLWLPWFDFATLSAVRADAWHLTLPSIHAADIALLANPALAIALLCVLEGTSIGKTLAARAGERLDANQEMLSIGAANIACGFCGGMPASGSLTRSVLNWTSGATSPLASILSGLLMVAGVIGLGPLIGYIPRPTLAVLVICIGVSLINRHAIRVVVRTTNSDAIVFFVTCVAGLLLPFDAAIYYGVACSILLFLRKAAAPELIEYAFTDSGELTSLDSGQAKRIPEVSIVHVEGNLFFGAADLFRDQIRRVLRDPDLKVVILKMRNAHLLDASSVMALEELLRYMRERGRHLLVSEAHREVIRVFKRSGLLESIGRDNVFVDIPSNHTLSSARAVRRARTLIGGGEARVSVYTEETKRPEQ